MKHNTKENLSHIKVALFLALICAEVGLAWLAEDNLALNALAVIITAYAFYQLDNIYSVVIAVGKQLLHHFKPEPQPTIKRVKKPKSKGE